MGDEHKIVLNHFAFNEGQSAKFQGYDGPNPYNAKSRNGLQWASGFFEAGRFGK